MIAEHPDLIAVLRRLHAERLEYGVPEGMDSDNGSVFAVGADKGLLREGHEVLNVAVATQGQLLRCRRSDSVDQVPGEQAIVRSREEGGVRHLRRLTPP